MTKHFLTICGILLLVIVVGAALVVTHRQPSSHQNMPTTAPSLVNQTTLNALPHKSASSADTSRVATGIVPPTNSWLSGMVLQKTPEPVYPMPLSFLAKTSGFEIGLPTVQSTATQISGEHVAGISVDLGATNFSLTRLDKLSATLSYVHGNTTLGYLTLAEGSPYVFYHAATAATLNLSAINPSDVLEHSSHYARYQSNGHTYAVLSQQGSLSLSSSGIQVSVKNGDLVTLYAVPGSSDVLKTYAANALQSVDVSYQLNGTSANTTFSLHTANHQPTVFVSMPSQSISGKQLTTFDSIYGSMPALSGTTFTTTAPAVAASNSLDLSHLSATHRQQLITTLAADVATTTIDKQDSYYAGKQLARAANLLSLAEQLKQPALATKLTTILVGAFHARLGGNYFYYDTTLKGVAATTAAFGSQDFNDHHFHYGYWLYAASILGQYDATFLAQSKDQLNLLAADIANYQAGSTFPLYRNYDPYAGHSWAAGLAPFADGNNQESSSEALHAWNGVVLWGRVSNNEALQVEGQWMLAGESQAASAAWRSISTSLPALKNYTSPITSLNFGGKRVYSTFFSDDPAAKLGIQLIPMDPSMTSFKSDGNASAVIAATIHGDNYNVPLGDYILMYDALINPTQAASLAPKQTMIDDGNSRSYLNAWIFSQVDK